jgi:YYY domain-containing protein
MDWITQTLFWYGHLLLLGLVFFPLTKRIFSRFFDYGYAFSKTLAIIVCSYLAFIAGILHLSGFTQLLLYIIILITGILNFYLVWKDKEIGELLKAFSAKWLVFLFEEALFLGAILWLAYVRGQEPSIHGLEKFMDFGFMDSIMRAQNFPPLDMWYSGGPDVNGVNHTTYPINYYYFGHLTGAFLMKLTGISPFVVYNLILATIFAIGITLTFSLIANIIHYAQKALKKVPYSWVTTFLFGVLGSYIVNFAGNLHTIYLFTKGYNNDTPVPFWQIWSVFNPTKYWYPNATRFIPFTIHEFPSYSYVVADLHGHVFDIPFVLFTLAFLFNLFLFKFDTSEDTTPANVEEFTPGNILDFLKKTVLSKHGLVAVSLGFLTAINYMTNAFDGPIYVLFGCVIVWFVYGFSQRSLVYMALIGVAFILFSRPFSAHFSLFVSGVGVNCAPQSIFDPNQKLAPGVTKHTAKIGPFLFEEGNCQKSEPWMLFILWGFFWIHALMLGAMKGIEHFFPRKNKDTVPSQTKSHQKHHKTMPVLPFANLTLNQMDVFAGILFAFGTFLIIIPEFFYVKDIYPAHFRANTMFKLGYQAFIMMGIASTYVIFRLKNFVADLNRWLFGIIFISVFAVFAIIFTNPISPDLISTHKGWFFEYLLLMPLILVAVIIIMNIKNMYVVIGSIFILITAHVLTLVAIYPFFGFPSYYANLSKTAEQRAASPTVTTLNGAKWLNDIYPEDLEMINYINKNIKGQPTILEAQGDSYTDYDRISSYTGLPTVAGWWVHEWLWRGTSDVVGKRIPDIENIYQSNDIQLTKQLLKKYHVKYVVVSELERKKYTSLNEKKFTQIGKRIFQSSNKLGALYQVN